MAGVPLRAFALVCAAVVVVADVVVYDEDLNKDHVPGITAHSWTMVDDGSDGPSNLVLEVQSTSMDGPQDSSQIMSDVLEQQKVMLREMGFSDPAVFGGGDNLGWGFGSGNAFDWAAQQFDRMQNLHNTLFASPCMMQDALADLLQSSLLAMPNTQDQDATFPDVQNQMLQNVACTRFGPALTAAKSQDDNSLELEDGIDSDADWDIEVVFWPSDSEFQHGNGEFDGMQRAQALLQAFRGEDALVEEGQYEDSSSQHSSPSVWSRIIFFTLLFGSILIILISIRQCCELRRAMKEASQKAKEEDVEFQECVNETKPLLSQKGFVVDEDGYTNIMIQPVQSEPALKAMYPVVSGP